jgi:hypothetical protein
MQNLPSKIYPNWDFWFEKKPSGNQLSGPVSYKNPCAKGTLAFHKNCDFVVHMNVGKCNGSVGLAPGSRLNFCPGTLQRRSFFPLGRHSHVWLSTGLCMYVCSLGEDSLLAVKKLELEF